MRFSRSSPPARPTATSSRAAWSRRARRITQPLNIGQIYTTLGRLERDHLVEGADSDDDGARGASTA